MSEVYTFLFCISLGIFGRLLFMLTSFIAKRTDILPITIILDAGVMLAIGGGFATYVILSGAVIAPYMFAALLSGYLLTYLVTRKSEKKNQ